MATTPYREIHRALQAKLGITARAVNMRRQKIQAIVGMPDDIALYIAAQREGVPIHRWVKDADMLAQVASFDSTVRGKEAGTATPAKTLPAAKARRDGRAGGSAEFALNRIRIPAGVLSDQHRRDAERMATEVFPLLYTFENSAREFIDGHLSAVYGPDWWDDPKVVSKDVRDSVERARNAAAANRTHSARTARPIYYTTLGDLVLIVQSEKGAKVFKRPLFPRTTWFPELVKASEHTRNIVAHMNPLKAHDINRLKIDFEDWLNQIKDHLPPSVGAK